MLLAAISASAAATPVAGLEAGQIPLSQVAPAKPSADVTQTGSLPANHPTGDSASVAAPAVEPPTQQLDVDLVGGKITVDASNVGLNKVLHAVAAKADIKIVGGISDELVFGHYGPASPAAILALLLDGTGTNMLLVDDSKGASELVLTQRVGGATPPGPAAANSETERDEEGRGSRYVPPNRPFQPPGPGRGPLAQPPNLVPGGAARAPNSAEPSQSSGDQKTPQQIFDQLQDAQQKQNPPQ